MPPPGIQSVIACSQYGRFVSMVECLAVSMESHGIWKYFQSFFPRIQMP